MKLKLMILFATILMVAGLNHALAHRSPAAPPSAFIGTWQTTWKTTDGRTVSAPVTVRADTGNANGLDGMVEVTGPNGLMYGTLSADGKTWSGNWWNNDGIHGTFTFTLKDNKTFTGSYAQSGASGDYDGHGNK